MLKSVFYLRPSFPLYRLSLQLLTQSTVHRHAISLFFVVGFLLILSDVDSMHFATFVLLHVKRLQLKIDLC